MNNPDKMPADIAAAIERLTAEASADPDCMSVSAETRITAARIALTTAILSRLTAAETENTRLTERLEDKTRSLRVEIAAKLGAYNEIKILEEENARLRDALAWTQEVTPAVNEWGQATVCMSTEEFERMRTALAPAAEEAKP